MVVAQLKEVASIIKQLKEDKGQQIPVAFRLWHECEDNRMWWGPGSVNRTN